MEKKSRELNYYLLKDFSLFAPSIPGSTISLTAMLSSARALIWNIWKQEEVSITQASGEKSSRRHTNTHFSLPEFDTRETRRSIRAGRKVQCTTGDVEAGEGLAAGEDRQENALHFFPRVCLSVSATKTSGNRIHMHLPLSQALHSMSRATR